MKIGRLMMELDRLQEVLGEVRSSATCILMNQEEYQGENVKYEVNPKFLELDEADEADKDSAKVDTAQYLEDLFEVWSQKMDDADCWHETVGDNLIDFCTYVLKQHGQPHKPKKRKRG